MTYAIFTLYLTFLSFISCFCAARVSVFVQVKNDLSWRWTASVIMHSENFGQQNKLIRLCSIGHHHLSSTLSYRTALSIITEAAINHANSFVCTVCVQVGLNTHTHTHTCSIGLLPIQEKIFFFPFQNLNHFLETVCAGWNTEHFVLFVYNWRWLSISSNR